MPSQEPQVRAWAYALTVAGGALILGASGLLLLFGLVLAGVAWAGAFTVGQEIIERAGIHFGWIIALGVFSGILVLWSGVRMEPGGEGDGHAEGVLAIVGSILSFPATGGFFFGAIFGVIGGALAWTAGKKQHE